MDYYFVFITELPFQFSYYCFAGAGGVADFDFDVGVKRKEHVDAGTELDDAALLAGSLYCSFLGIAYYTAGEGACYLLEEDFSVLALEGGRRVLVLF